ncbi:MAG: hypothetical protein ACKO7W_15940 [Elainella sp.]
MSNLRFLSSISGVISILLAVFFLVSAVLLLVRGDGSMRGMLLIQAIFVPLVLMFVGNLVLSVGWKLDPLLHLAFFLMNLVIIFLGVKDILINRSL